MPILVFWFGVGWVPPVMTAFLISFFPIVVNVATGIATVEPEMEDVLRALGASKRDIVFKVGVPRAMPYFFGSLKVAITLAYVGSVIGEQNASNVRHRQPASPAPPRPSRCRSSWPPRGARRARRLHVRDHGLCGALHDRMGAALADGGLNQKPSVIPGRSVSGGKGIHGEAARSWMPFPVQRTAGEDDASAFRQGRREAAYRRSDSGLSDSAAASG